MILGVLGVEVCTRNRSKIDQNLKPKTGCFLASIFDGFWWILEGKLGGKTEPRSAKINSKRHQKNDEKKSATWSPQGGSAVPGTQLCCGPGGTLNFKDEE